MGNLKFVKPKGFTEVLEENGTKARFSIKTLERGYGITLGNSLRRVLLSSMPGAAIAMVKIEGVDHEFSTISGVYEDVMSIILQLKQVIVKVDSNDPEYEEKISISKVGPAKITAADFSKVPGLEIINPELEIANLSKGATFNMVATIRRGVGYVPADENKKLTKNEIGQIAIDSLYSPIKRVAYHVEKTRGDDDELFLDVETNGAIVAKDAIAIASKMLIDYLEIIKEVSKCEMADENFIEEEKIIVENPNLKKTLAELDLKTGVFNALTSAGIRNVEQLTKLTEKDLTSLDKIGPEAIKGIRAELEKLDLTLLDDNVEGDE